MSKITADSFLPSGAVDSQRMSFSSLSSSAISPLSGPAIPRSVPITDFMPSPHGSNGASPSPKTHMQSRSPSQHPNGPPLSPPKTRSPSADDTTAALVEDWRVYTAKLRSQNEGEKAHMIADRKMMEEVMAEERELWEAERKILKARIAELEAHQDKRGSHASISPPTSHKGSANPARQAISFTSPGSNAVSVTGSIDGSSSRAIRQESGRNADGSPFYAPAPRNPSRTFEASETADLRVDSITAPRESAIRVTSKELTSSDFIQSPPSTHDLESIQEDIPESIDISMIQPELEGVPIRASAVSPTFAAKVLSPMYSPSKLSPNIKPAARDVATSLSRSNSSAKEKDKTATTLEVACQPENRRLTMHAGHTPNHSISKLGWLDGGSASGDATPRQEHRPGHIHHPSVAPGLEYFTVDDDAERDQGDKELSGPLGLTNESSKDDAFLQALVEKLEEARKSQPVSPSNESGSSVQSEGKAPSQRNSIVEDGDEDEKEEGPPLRLKPSFNFGRPMGRM